MGGGEIEAFLAPSYATGNPEMIFVLICILVLQEDILKWMLAENCMEVLLSTKLNLSDVTSHIQAGLKSTESVVKLISSNQPHTNEVTKQSNSLPMQKKGKSSLFFTSETVLCTGIYLKIF